MDNFEIYLHNIEYPDGRQGKYRPVVILDGDKYVLEIVGIYSERDFMANSSGFYKIIDYNQAGLDVQSFIRLENIAEANFEAISTSKRIGHLTDHDIDGLLDALERYYG